MALRNPKPWHRGDGESGDAYAAFLSYLRLGPGRTLAAAWRSFSGGGGDLKRPYPTRWGTWRSGHDWDARAAAYDGRHAAAAAAGKGRSWRRSARDWYLRRERHNEREYQFGLELWGRAVEMLRESRPVRVPGRLKDNVVPPSREFGPMELKRLQEVGSLAGAMIRDACTRSIPQQSVVPGLSVVQLSEDPEVRAQAQRDVARWDAEQTPAVVAFLNSRNPLDDPDPTPDHPGGANGRANSGGAGTTPPTSATGTA